MGIPTVFNLLGPLTNPARPAAQVVGVADPRMLPVLASVLAQRGTRAYVFRGSDGLDELTTTGPSEVHEVGSGEVHGVELDPETLGIPRVLPGDLAGGDVETNAGIARAVLEGESGPARDIVCLNAAAALTVAGTATDLTEGLDRARESIDSRKAARVLDRWVDVSNF